MPPAFTNRHRFAGITGYCTIGTWPPRISTRNPSPAYMIAKCRVLPPDSSNPKGPIRHTEGIEPFWFAYRSRSGYTLRCEIAFNRRKQPNTLTRPNIPKFKFLMNMLTRPRSTTRSRRKTTRSMNIRYCRRSPYSIRFSSSRPFRSSRKKFVGTCAFRSRRLPMRSRRRNCRALRRLRNTNVR